MLKRWTVVISSMLLIFSVSFTLSTTAQAKSWLESGGDLLNSLLGSKKTDSATAVLSNADITDGLKDALRVGTERVVSQLGQTNGFSDDELIYIPLPSQLQTAKNVLERIGMGSMMEDLELKLNRAAEAATPKAKVLFWDAIKDMSFEDARQIYNGPDDAATQYLRGKMNTSLAQEMRPLIQRSLSEVGAVQAYERAIGRYENIPFVPDVKANLTNYTVEKGMDGIFYYLAQEEAAIRKDPLKRSTEILRKVFGR